MSETSPESSPTPDSQSPANDSSGGTRKMVLYGLLALMIVALGYDYLVARPAVSAAYDQITNASVQANSKGVGFLSNENVRELIGKEPAETFMDGSHSVEVFHWPGGLIVKPHKLYTVYTKSGDGWLFTRHAKFAYDKAIDVFPDRTIVEPAEGADLQAEYDAEESGGGPGAEGDGEGRPPAESTPESESNEPDSGEPGAEADAPSRPELEGDPAE